jgi:transposase
MSNRKLKTGKSTNFTIRQRRVFSEPFKREKVDDILNKRISIAELSKLWEVSDTAIRYWIRQYSPSHKKGTTMVVQQDSESIKTQELLKRVAELERTIGQKQMVIDYQDKLLEVASKELEIDIKKNFSPTP